MNNSTHSGEEKISAELATLVERTFHVLREINRSDPVAEAQVAAAEVLHFLAGISGTEAFERREEVLRQALGSGRAAVGALWFALAESRSSCSGASRN